jgi:hypothetical protein
MPTMAKAKKRLKKSKIKYGKVDILDDSFLDKRNHNIKVDLWIEGDLLDLIKKQAAKIRASYHGYILSVLRHHLVTGELIERLEKIEDLMGLRRKK